MPKKPDLLNVREYIKYVVLIMEAYEEYGDCPSIRDEIPKLLLIGKAILNANDKKRIEGNRKDIYVEAEVKNEKRRKG